jgi:26S proteasome regulatory subunit N2
MSGLTSVCGYIAGLQDDDVVVQEHSLRILSELVDQFWAEIAEALPRIEELYENENFPSRELAALVTSKVFYHLESLDDAMQFALGAKELFNLFENSEYVNTITAKCIDEYTKLKRQHFELQNIATTRSSKAEIKPIDKRLESIVERMFVRCFEDKEFKQALGIAVESMRLDIAEKAILNSDNTKAMLQYCYEVCMNLVVHRDYRCTVLELLVQLYRKSDVCDYVNQCRCLLFLGKSKEIAEIFNNLLNTNNLDDVLLVFQIAFDLVDNASQLFLTSVREALPSPDDPARITLQSNNNLRQLIKILQGDCTIEFYLEFLYRNNHADLGVLKKLNLYSNLAYQFYIQLLLWLMRLCIVEQLVILSFAIT